MCLTNCRSYSYLGRAPRTQRPHLFWNHSCWIFRVILKRRVAAHSHHYWCDFFLLSFFCQLSSLFLSLFVFFVFLGHTLILPPPPPSFFSSCGRLNSPWYRECSWVKREQHPRVVHAWGAPHRWFCLCSNPGTGCACSSCPEPNCCLVKK